MTTRIERFYEHDIFQNMKGLPEEIVKFEAKTGQSLPDRFHYKFLQGIDVGDALSVLGKIGEFYVAIVEKDEKPMYELFEDKQSLKLWAIDLLKDVSAIQENMALSEEETNTLEMNKKLFMQKVERITSDEDDE